MTTARVEAANPSQPRAARLAAAVKWLPWLCLGLWLLVVLVTVANHEYFCDEVRALSIARSAHSPVDLIHALQNEGHPCLWYAVLSVGNLFGRPSLILPVASVGIALAAVAIFMFASPFPLWFRAVFLFSCLPLYEYSVMARNYGLTMLLLFTFAALYRYRQTRPLLPALALALLANSHFYGTIAAAALSVYWLLDTRWRSPWRTLVKTTVLPMLLVLAAAALAYVTMAPTSTSRVVRPELLNLGDMVHCLPATLFPYRTFPTLLPQGVTDAVSRTGVSRMFAEDLYNFFLLGAILGALGRPRLVIAALVGTVGYGISSQFVYSWTGTRQQGLFLVFLLVIYWLAIQSGATRGARWQRYALYGGLGIVLALIVGTYSRGYQAIDEDLRYELSSNRAFGHYLVTHPVYRNAIIVPEHPQIAESLPYYAGNRLYMAREHCFRDYALLSTTSATGLTLGQLLDEAERVKAQCSCPVLVVLAHTGVAEAASGRVEVGFFTYFTWSALERQRLDRETTLVAKYTHAVHGENYLVYEVRDDAPGAPGAPGAPSPHRAETAPSTTPSGL